MASQDWRWYIEYSSPHHGYMYAIQKYIYSGETPFQQVDIVDTYAYGRCLILDGKIQSTQFDEHIYHEALIHPAVVFHSSPRRILVMGSGEGAALRELCKYPFIEEIIMVDIDRQVVDLCRQHLAAWHRGSFNDSRVTVLFQDARRYINETNQQFDIIYSDLSEPDSGGPSYRLFTRQFYELVRRRLAPGGLLVVQAGGISLDYMDVHGAVRNTLGLCFNNIRSYRTYVPSFESDWGFIIASNRDNLPDLSSDQVDGSLGDMESGLKFYDGQTHGGMFYLPKDIRSALQRDKTIIEDDRPLSVY